MKAQKLWIFALIVAGYCSLALEAIPVGRINNTQIGGGSIKNAAVDEVVEADETQVLFEGDIEISIENIHKFYDLTAEQDKELMSTVIGKNSNRVSHVGRRAATSDEDMLWTDRTVPYVIHSSAERRRNMIMEAIRAWSDSTCLRFIERTSQSDYIQFIEHNEDFSSSAVGRSQNRQKIRLTNDQSLSSGIIMHEIGHALGLWHEQSRPDRDSYVTVYWDNIQSGKEHNFKKRKDEEVDYQGTEYDYGSIMHYRRTTFLKNGCTGSCLTLNVRNFNAFQMQGSPSIGQRNALSTRNIEQVNRLYSCPSPGEQGFLILYIRNGINLLDTDNAEPYVTVKAISSTGNEYYKKTSYKQNTQNPTWKEWLLFSDKQWQFFRIRAWDNGDDDPVAMSHTIPLLNQPRSSKWQKYCTNTACTRYIWFDYKLLTPVRGSLRVKVRYARNLPDTDPIWNDPDPYTRISAIRPDGSSSSKQTRSIQGTRDPTWNQWLEMSGCEHAGFKVQVWDNDISYDDEMSDSEFIEVSSGYHSDIKHCVSSSCNSYLYLDYELTPDGNECDPNPCQNGGTCIDGCLSYSCSCTSSYTGDRCQYRQGRLTFYARYGRNLPDKDSWGAGNSDPYIKFVAYDAYGNSYEKKTITDYGDNDPEWYDNVDFGTRTWRKFKVSVWDKDNVYDDRLSSTQTWYLPTTRSASAQYVTLNAYEGFVKFDYTYT